MAVLTSPDNVRAEGPVKLARYTMVVASGDSTTDIDIDDIEGQSELSMLTVPDLDNSDTAELVVLDPWGGRMFESGELAESTTQPMNMDPPVPFTGRQGLRIECSGAQAAARTFNVTIYYR